MSMQGSSISHRASLTCLLLLIVGCNPALDSPGDHIGSWLLISNNGVLEYPLGRTVFTLQPDGQWIQDYNAPDISGTSFGTYEIRKDTLATRSPSGVTDEYIYHATPDSLMLSLIIEPFSSRQQDNLAYVKVDGRAAAFGLTAPSPR